MNNIVNTLLESASLLESNADPEKVMNAVDLMTDEQYQKFQDIKEKYGIKKSNDYALGLFRPKDIAPIKNKSGFHYVDDNGELGTGRGGKRLFSDACASNEGCFGDGCGAREGCCNNGCGEDGCEDKECRKNDDDEDEDDDIQKCPKCGFEFEEQDDDDDDKDEDEKFVEACFRDACCSREGCRNESVIYKKNN